MASKKVLIDIRVTDKQASVSVNKTSKSVDNLASSTRAFTAAQKAANTEIQKGATAAGLAGAIVTEFGRTVSDLPFGFVAIQNNLSQLASLVGLFFANAARSGLTAAEAFKELRTQFLGPVGVLTLFQIALSLFTSQKVKNFISSLFRINDSFRILRDILPQATKNAQELIGNFELYTSIIKDATETQEQKAIAIKKLNQEYPDFNSNILQEAENNREATRAINEYTDALERRAISQAAEDKFREIRSKIFDIELRKELDVQEEVIKLNKRLQEEEIGYVQTKQGSTEAVVVTEEQKVTQYAITTQAIINSANEEIDVERNKLDVLRKLIDLEFKQKKSGAIRDRKEFRRGRLALEQIEESFRQKSIDQSLKTEEEKIRLAGDFSKREIDIRVESFKKTQEVRLKNYIDDINSSKLSEERKNELIKAANRDFNQSIIDAEEDASAVRIQIEAATSQELKELSDERRERVIDNIDKIRDAEEKLSDARSSLAINQEQLTLFEEQDADGLLDFGKKVSDFNIEQSEKQKQRIKEELDANNEAIQSIKDKLATEELDAETRERLGVALSDLQLNAVKLDNDYTKASQKNVTARLAYAKAEFEGKRELLNLTGEALLAFSDLAGEETKAGKQLAIAGTIISTYTSSQKAYESQFTPIPTPTSPVRGALAAAAAFASGMARVQAILAVDPSGETGPPATVEAPNFNVVGASATNQLAQTVQATLPTQQQNVQPQKVEISLVDLDLKNNEFKGNITTAGF